jgi:hypothetical protein
MPRAADVRRSSALFAATTVATLSPQRLPPPAHRREDRDMFALLCLGSVWLILRNISQEWFAHGPILAVEKHFV